MTSFKNVVTTFALVCALGLSACATTSVDQNGNTVVYDPLEPVNRVTLSFNELLDKILFNPITIVYRTIVPAAGRDMVHNVLSNARMPVHLANELLQGDLNGAGVVLKRFAINTFTGFGGLLDTASWGGITHENSDFGQTLAVWGVGPGPYIVLPLLGPSTLRDTVGTVADIGMDPLYWYAHNTHKEGWNYGRAIGAFVSAKDRTYNLQTDLRRNSGDYYTSLQSVYMQRRAAQIQTAKTGSFAPVALPVMD